MKNIVIIVIIVILSTIIFAACVYDKRDITESALKAYFEENEWTNLIISDNNRFVPSNISRVLDEFDSNTDYGNNHNKLQVVFGKKNGHSMIAFVSENKKIAIESYQIPFNIEDLVDFAEANIDDYDQYSKDLMIIVNEQVEYWSEILDYSKGIFFRVMSCTEIEYIAYYSSEGFKIIKIRQHFSET